MTHLARFFRALADPNRLRIVSLLARQSLCVCELQMVLGLSQPFISRHLAYLRRAGLVRHQRQGARVSYSLALDIPAVGALEALLRELVPLSPTLQADLRHLAEAIRSGGLRALATGQDSAMPRAA
jgi:ArsR family transcriptional regulator